MWWSEECKAKSEEVRKSLRSWGRGRNNREEYKRKRMKYRDLCERMKEEVKEGLINEAEQVRNEGGVWRIIKLTLK